MRAMKKRAFVAFTVFFLASSAVVADDVLQPQPLAVGGEALVQPDHRPVGRTDRVAEPLMGEQCVVSGPAYHRYSSHPAYSREDLRAQDSPTRSTRPSGNRHSYGAKKGDAVDRNESATSER